MNPKRPGAGQPAPATQQSAAPGRQVTSVACRPFALAVALALAAGTGFATRLVAAGPETLHPGPPPAAAVAEVPEPEDYRTDDYRTPVPRTLKGARLITADDAQTLMSDAAAVFIDVYPRAPRPPNLPAGTVWRDPPHMSIAGAHWLPNVGYGVLSPEFETYFTSRLETLTGRDAARPVVFFCLKDCWMSWNAAKRALSWGYRSVIWFPEGTDGWQAIGNDLVPVVPVP